MFFVLSKILYFLILPFSWLFIALIGSFITRNPRYKRRLRRFSLLIIVLFSNNFLANQALGLLEVPPVKLKENYDLAVVLTGITHHGVGIPDQTHFAEGVDRLTEAIKLYETGTVSKILITGGAADINNPDENEGIELGKMALALGVASEDLIIENNAKNTHENAKFSKPVVSKFQAPLLITSAFHMPRAKACFEKQGTAIATYPVDYQTSGGFHPVAFVPSIDAFKKWNILIKELVGLTVYKIMGYI